MEIQYRAVYFLYVFPELLGVYLSRRISVKSSVSLDFFIGSRWSSRSKGEQRREGEWDGQRVLIVLFAVKLEELWCNNAIYYQSTLMIFWMHYREKMVFLGSKVTWASKETGWETLRTTSLGIWCFSSSEQDKNCHFPSMIHFWLQGDNGATGPRGEDGTEGLKGQAGLQGDIGPPGIAGEKVYFLSLH